MNSLRDPVYVWRVDHFLHHLLQPTEVSISPDIRGKVNPSLKIGTSGDVDRGSAVTAMFPVLTYTQACPTKGKVSAKDLGRIHIMLPLAYFGVLIHNPSYSGLRSTAKGKHKTTKKATMGFIRRRSDHHQHREPLLRPIFVGQIG